MIRSKGNIQSFSKPFVGQSQLNFLRVVNVTFSSDLTIHLPPNDLRKIFATTEKLFELYKLKLKTKAKQAHMFVLL